jgi:hypothetical protein
VGDENSVPDQVYIRVVRVQVLDVAEKDHNTIDIDGMVEKQLCALKVSIASDRAG